MNSPVSNSVAGKAGGGGPDFHVLKEIPAPPDPRHAPYPQPLGKNAGHAGGHNAVTGGNVRLRGEILHLALPLSQPLQNPLVPGSADKSVYAG